MTRYDHGHAVDESRQCSADTVSGRQCRNRALLGKPNCATHEGLAANDIRGIEAMARTNQERTVVKT